MSGTDLVASRDGVLHIDGNGQMRVDSVVVIDGDIDNEFGSIDTDFPVHVLGDIKAGFSVRAGGFLEVDGVIEDATIQVEGDLTVRRGILPGQRIVRVAGDVAALYIRDREIHARNVAIIKDIRHCTVNATEKVFSNQIIGGECHAVLGIHLQVAGNEEEEPTLLDAGFDPELRTALAATKHCQRLTEVDFGQATHDGQEASSLASELTKRLEIQKKSGASTTYLRSLAKEAKDAVVKARYSRQTMMKLQSALDELNQQRDELQLQRDTLRQQVTIRIESQVHPRVTFSVGGVGSDVSLQSEPGGLWRVHNGSVMREAI